jgi:cysteine desulfurase
MCRHLETEGFRLTILPVDCAGCIDPADLAAAVDYRTAIVAILLVNNETGTVQDVSGIASTAHNAGALLHVDAVQALGKMPLDVNSLGADMLSVSGHKINGPKGSGALFIRRGVKLKPLLYGGGQEKKQRPGTLNVPAVAGFGQACEIARRDMDDNVRHCVFLRDRFERGILECIDCAEVNGSHDARICNTLNVSFHGHSGEVIASMLDLAGIAVSTGSACNAGRGESRVLKAMGLDSQAVFGAVRFSVGRYNSAEEIDLVVDKLAEVIGRLDEHARAVDIRKI